MTYSEINAGASVTFPEFTGERVYMREFTPGCALPIDLERWQSTVDAMLSWVRAAGKAYLMIDQGEVESGTTHRRPGLHVDGYWQTAGHGGRIMCHGNEPAYPRHGGRPQPQPSPGHGFNGSSEALIVASDIEGCEAFVGQWSGKAGRGGDCSAIPISSLERKRMLPMVAWVGETGALLHSAIPLSRAAKRTVVRINVQGWSAGF